MGEIRLISSSIVQAANPKNEIQRKIELTPWDLTFIAMDYAPRGLLFHKPKLQREQDRRREPLVQRLKTSLSQTLNYFYPFAGRLATIELDNETTSFFIDCNNAGVLFVHAEAKGISISHIVEVDIVPSFVRELFQLNEVRNYEGTSKPLLAVQVTELDDGIFISYNSNHLVADGTLVLQFIKSWAEIYRGCIELSEPPFLQRWFPDAIEAPIGIPNSYLAQAKRSDGLIPPPLQSRIFHFTKESIAKLKAKANAEVGTYKISSFQALMSHTWRAVIRNKNPDPSEETNFFVVVGGRSRLQQLSQQYMGNAIQCGFVTMKVKDLLERGLGYVAWEISKFIASHSEENMMKFLELWKESPLLLSSNIGSGRSNPIVVADSPRFDYYGVDFGWGRPIAIRRGDGNKHEGKIFLYCGAQEGSMELEACFSPQTLQALAHDEAFMDCNSQPGPLSPRL